ncbi:MAG: hypothetical protein WCK33_08900 [Phycisphaerae bacterium]
MHARIHRLGAVALGIAAFLAFAVVGGVRTSGSVVATAARVPFDASRCVVIGASVSAGCEASLPGFRPAGLRDLVGHCNFAGVLGAVGAGTPAKGDGDSLFFMSPDSAAARQLAMARAASPSVLFAVDFLFWHAYGDRIDAAGRRERLRKGLAELATFTCPVVVGDIPDMSHTILISKAQFPGKEAIDAMNVEIRQWAAARPNVVLIPLFDIVGKAIREQPLSFGGRQFTGQEARALLTFSGLHVTPAGLIALSHDCLARLAERRLLPPNVAWDKDVEAITGRLVQAHQETVRRRRSPAATPGERAVGP